MENTDTLSPVPEHWQRCDSPDHVGPEMDATVEWRESGLMCHTCWIALGDVRTFTYKIEELEKELALAHEEIQRLRAQARGVFCVSRAVMPAPGPREDTPAARLAAKRVAREIK